MKKIAINGLGRIGRAAMKIILDSKSFDLVAVNDIVPVENLAYLLKYDSVYGRYDKVVKTEKDMLIIHEQKIWVFNEKDPANLPWKEMEVDIVLESTGIFTDAEGLQKHIDAGAKKVILSAPAKGGDVKTIVYGVNQASGGDKLISTASCTTNGITPVVEIMDRRVGVAKAIMTTTHAYTSSQPTVDLPSKKMRRGRAGAQNIVPTTTGAAKATSKVLPQMEGIFDGIALRVPVPVGSIADLVFVTKRKVTESEINEIFTDEAKSEKYRGILNISNDPLVSTDIIKDTHACIVDLEMTQVVDGDLVKILSWYDNEWGYASQMVKQALEL
ncbi:MAG: type I glyceraldehyde-3-phosphate dehydrogenase [Bacteroidales bacterium]